MEWLGEFWNQIIHLDKTLSDIIAQTGYWVYAVLFGIVFLETGFVIFPFLPGDSLLFTAGVLSHEGGLNVGILMALFPCAALCGDVTNYTIGKWVGPRIFRNPNSRILNPKNLDKTHAFMEKYGPKAIIIARFVPLIRTMCPFVAGMGYMTFGRFIRYSVIGALVWTVVCVGAGYLFGQIPIVRQNFAVAILGIILVTIIPIAVEFIRHRKIAKREALAGEAHD